MGGIIHSILDTDLYKLTMGQAVLHRYDPLEVEYTFINRGQTKFPKHFAEALTDQVKHMAGLKLHPGEADYLNSSVFYYLKKGYVEWLSGYRFNPDEVLITQEDGDLGIKIRGPWYRTIYWEVPLLATISELYYNMMGILPDNQWRDRAIKKAKIFNELNVKIAEFGTRRRYSRRVQEQVVGFLRQYACPSINGGVLNGTSNVDLAYRYRLTPIGTYAHEWVMAHSAMFGTRMANTMAMDAWEREFDASLGIALTDTYTTDGFLESFSAHYAKLFDGVRQDSGDPLIFADKIIEHYQRHRINPLHKTIVFSDALNTAKAVEINNYCRGKIPCSFGIGTHLTNDVGVTPLNMVIKLSAVTLSNGRHLNVVKLSDDKGKITGDPKAVENARFEAES
jgi:nicotinate phosphoribosyltransferase